MTYSIDIDANHKIYKELKAGTCDLYFDYEDTDCGVEVTVTNGIKSYTAWFGDEIKHYDDENKVVADKFFSGKSIDDLIDVVQFDAT